MRRALEELLKILLDIRMLVAFFQVGVALREKHALKEVIVDSDTLLSTLLGDGLEPLDGCIRCFCPDMLELW